MSNFWKGTDGPEESEAEESAESPEEKANEFANAFTLRRVDRSFVTAGFILVVVVFNNDTKPTSPREYEYYIPVENYKYDKVEIGKEIQRQHKERASGGPGGRKK